MSLPAWECGLKSLAAKRQGITPVVTPCVGVWIEIKFFNRHSYDKAVTPCVGVWIEMMKSP